MGARLIFIRRQAIMKGRDLFLKALDLPTPKTVNVTVEFAFDGSECKSWYKRITDAADTAGDLMKEHCPGLYDSLAGLDVASTNAEKGADSDSESDTDSDSDIEPAMPRPTPVPDMPRQAGDVGARDKPRDYTSTPGYPISGSSEVTHGPSVSGLGGKSRNLSSTYRRYGDNLFDGYCVSAADLLDEDWRQDRETLLRPKVFSKAPETPTKPSSPKDKTQPPSRKRQREHASWIGTIKYPDGTESPPFGPGDLDNVYATLRAEKEPISTSFTPPRSYTGLYDPTIGDYVEWDDRLGCYIYPDGMRYWPDTGLWNHCL